MPTGYVIACPRIQQSAPISALIKPIWALWYPTHIVNRPSELWGGRVEGSLTRIVGQVQIFFVCYGYHRAQFGLISAEIGAPCRIRGHANIML